MNILISCAGGPAAVGIIKSVAEFNDSTHKVVAIDCDELSVGFHLADKSYVVPFSVEDDFWKEVLKVIIPKATQKKSEVSIEPLLSLTRSASSLAIKGNSLDML